MFTGLVQSAGTVAAVARKGGECRFVISPGFSLDDMALGESVACNGACLSVESFDSSTFTVYASGETMRRTNLGTLVQGSLVNLERALRVGDRLGGHIVAGHVDCLARVTSVEPAGQSLVCTFSYPREFAPEVVAKGSVCLDGISLTVNDCAETSFSVNIIPDTQQRTSMRLWKPGYEANMETDVLGKYVRRVFALGAGPAEQPKSCLSREFLAERGYL